MRSWQKKINDKIAKHRSIDRYNIPFSIVSYRRFQTTKWKKAMVSYNFQKSNVQRTKTNTYLSLSLSLRTFLVLCRPALTFVTRSFLFPSRDASRRIRAVAAARLLIINKLIAASVEARLSHVNQDTPRTTNTQPAWGRGGEEGE